MASETDLLLAALHSDRAAIEEQLVALDAQYAGLVEAERGAPSDDEHDPDGATVGFERAQLHSIIAMHRSHLHDLELAEQRLMAGVLSCEVCGGEIAAERLRVVPTTRRCVACQSFGEHRGRRPEGA